MSHQAITAAISARDFSSSEKLVLMILAYRANEKDGTCFPSLASIAEDTGCNLKTVRKALHALQEAGWLIDTGKRVGNTHQITVWQVVSDESERVPKTEGFQKRKGTNFGPERVPILVPVKGREKEDKSVVNARETEIQDSPDQPDVTANRRGELSAFLRQQGVNVTPMNPHLCQWVNSDLTDDEAQDAVDRARISKPAPAAIPAAYLAAIVPKVIAERSERLKKCPAVAATTPGALSSTNPNRGHHHARQNATQQRASINTFLRNASNPDGVVELTPEQFEHHRLAVPENGGMLREPLDFAVSVGRRVNHPFIEVVEQYPVWVN